MLALLCSGVAWASLPRPEALSLDQQRQWQALGVAPLSSGGPTGMPMAPTASVEAVDFVPKRAAPVAASAVAVVPAPVAFGPLRIRGRVGDGLYWSLRAAGASPQVAAQYLAALATEIDVGEVGPSDGFDMVLGANHDLLYAGLSRVTASSLQLVRWNANGRGEWIDAANAERPAPSASGLMMPANGPVTSYFGYRYHPILHFTRFHAGLDIGAGWGSPIVAAADSQQTYNRARPALPSAAVAAPASPGYPDERAAAAGAAESVLAYVFPTDADLFASWAAARFVRRQRGTRVPDPGCSFRNSLITEPSRLRN